MSDHLSPEKFVENAHFCTKHCTYTFGDETLWRRLQRSPKVPSWIKWEGIRGKGEGRKENGGKRKGGKKEATPLLSDLLATPMLRPERKV